MLSFTKTPDMSRSWILSVFLCLAIWNSLQGQLLENPSFLEVAQQGLTYTYNADFDQANELFLNLQEELPEHPAPYFLAATNRWWQYSQGGAQKLLPYVDSQLNHALFLNEKLKAEPNLDEEYALFEFLTHALKARLLTEQQAWLHAANQGRKTLPHLEICLAQADSSREFGFIAGVYHYYAETYSRSNPLVRPFMMFFPDGNVRKGLAELEMAAQQPNLMQAEALYYLSYIYLEPYARDTVRVQQVAKRLQEAYPRNPWFACELARVKVHTGFHSEALGPLNAILDRYQAQPEARTRLICSHESKYSTLLAMRAHYYRGLCYLHGREDPSLAFDEFEAALDYAALMDMKEAFYPCSSQFYQAQCLEMMGRKEEARQAYQQYLTGDDLGGHKEEAVAGLERVSL